jgi:hypothetical protein
LDTINDTKAATLTQSVIGEKPESVSAFITTANQGKEGSKRSPASYPQSTTSLPTRNLPLDEIARKSSPSNDNQHPSTRLKGIARTIDLGPASTTAATTITTSTSTSTSTSTPVVPALASPASIYSNHIVSVSPKTQAMPLSVSRSHQEWDQSGEYNLSQMDEIWLIIGRFTTLVQPFSSLSSKQNSRKFFIYTRLYASIRQYSHTARLYWLHLPSTFILASKRQSATRLEILWIE